ncbi:FAD binding domain-containing protein [Heyndrickxia coagulans]|uniref:FAD binding domain-containing protein n=1 Tax=Heyndrickxia coagulans TaxID=1398 RepID=UPI0015F349A8|nr:FAD binding domain-containing protein [Heyndrickxia coagulans]
MAEQEEIAAVPAAVYRPASIREAWELKRKFNENAAMIAGGTLLQMKREQGIAFPPCLISLENIQALQAMEFIEDGAAAYLKIGACVRLSALRKSLFVKKDWRILQEAVKQVAAPAVRNRATIGGNICYMSGDTIPALLALGAKVAWFSERGLKMDTLEVFLQQARLHSNTILASIYLPKQPPENWISFYQKVGRRAAFTPSLVVVSVCAKVSNENHISRIRIAAGGGAGQPKRLTASEALLEGAVLSEEILAGVYEKIMEEYDPLPGNFASAAYLKTAAANLIVSRFARFLDREDEADE